jgi:long-chain acyl-CoA synthetase
VCVLVESDIGKIELEEMKLDTPPCVVIHITASEELFNYNQKIIFTSNNPDYDSFDQDQLTDVCTMVYTAADDGFAKAAMLTKKNLLANAQGGIISNKVDNKSVLCALLPFHHMFGLQTGVLSPLLASHIAGSSILIENITELNNFKIIVNDIRKYKVTNLYSIPIIYYLLSRYSEISTALKNIKKLCSGGYKLPDFISDKFFNKTGQKIFEGYGITEASPVCSWYLDSDLLKKGSIGKPYPCCVIKILDAENNECFLDQIGEICIRGDNVMKGYYNNKTATQKTIKNGWLHTMDFGKIDNEGYLYITGLKKRMLNVAGRKVYPTEVERLLKRHENVKNVEVYGESHILQNNIVKAKIEMIQKGFEFEKELKEWYQNNISPYKIPKSIEYR